jgi:tRNA(fMet)-specific endonuclease VapC
LKGYLLDTCIVRYYFDQHPNVMANVALLADDDTISIAAITRGEIEFGQYRTYSTDPDRRAEYLRFINNEFPRAMTISITEHTGPHYGELKAKLFEKYQPRSKKENHPERCIDKMTGTELGIDENDLWIAALAIEHNLVLVTDDTMNKIRSVSDRFLDVQNWTDPP